MESACTSILVGKNASLDGSTMIARNDDTFLPLTPQRFHINPAVKNRKGAKIKSWLNGFEAELPENGYRWPAVPNVDYKHNGYYDESSINEVNVAMSCTESTYGNEKALAYDPLVKDGLDEDCMQAMVAPYINSAREGVSYLGNLIKQYGSPAGNSVLFSDHNEVWYMEIVTGHLWLAQRIPDDAYAVAANQVAIQQVDFNDPDHFMWAEGIQDYVETHHLNPDKTGWNFRHIFGTMNEKDRHYNTPRVWYAHHLFDADFDMSPESAELPFIRRIEHKISVEDIEFLLGSHYNETKFDPMGHGADEDKYRYRPIGLNRTQNAHILQLRNDVPKEQAAIMWITMGMPTYTPFIPFFTNANDTDPSFSETPMKWDMKSAYWLYRTISVLVEGHYLQHIQGNIDYLNHCKQELRTMIENIQVEARNYHGAALTDYLTEQNHAIVKKMAVEATAMIGELVMSGINLSKLTFNMDRNL